MNEQLIRLLNLINENKTLNEIRQIAKLNNEDLYKQFFCLKEQGYLTERKYYYDGNIRYINNSLTNYPDGVCIIETLPNTKNIRIIITGDTHLGHINEEIDAIDRMMEYCIDEDIHNIFHTGDFFQGIYGNNIKETKITDSYKQLEYGIDNYPYDELINTYICLGNHDITFLSHDNIDIKNMLLDKRHDLIPIGYGNGKIKILNNTFYLHHPISKYNINSLGETVMNSIIIKGHYHQFKVITGLTELIIYTPTLSSVQTKATKYNNLTYPSIIDAEFNLENGIIKDAYLQHFLIIDNNIIRVGEVVVPSINLYQKKKIKYEL